MWRMIGEVDFVEARDVIKKGFRKVLGLNRYQVLFLKKVIALNTFGVNKKNIIIYNIRIYVI
jgi:hypothetical protein